MSITAETRKPAGFGKIRKSTGRQRWDRIFLAFCIAISVISVLILVAILTAIFYQGSFMLSRTFLTSGPSTDVEQAGVGPALLGSVWVCGVCALLALPIGVATAILLEEYQPRSRSVRFFHQIIQLNITNLAGVPSVVYGILGLTAFVSMFGLFGRFTEPAWEVGVRHFDQFITEGDQVLLVPVSSRRSPHVEVEPGMRMYTPAGEPVTIEVIGINDPLPEDESARRFLFREDAEGGRIVDRAWYNLQLPLGRGVLAGALTLMLVTLPIVIISAQEAIRAVPDSLREGAQGLGATRWQVVWNVTLPASIPGIMTGAILAMSRAVGEAAPILIIAGIVYITNAPGNVMDDFTVLPLQIYNWAGLPNPEFHRLAASGIIVLLAILLCFNGLAIFIRNKLQKPLS
jgi:phosphate transport system permease protein